VTKRGSNFYFWTGNVFPNRSSDFLSQNGQSGSLLVFWPHSVFGQNHLCVKDALNRDSAIQSIIRRFCLQKSENSSCLSAVRTPFYPLFHQSGQLVIPSKHHTDKHYLSGRRASSVRTPTLYREGSVPACSVQTFQQHVRTSISSRTVL
jgi:hypothetical protein